MASNFQITIRALRTEHADFLGNRHFAITVLVALLLHVTAVYVWQLMPRPKVVEIPVRTLNIKLGEGGDLWPQEAAPAQPENHQNIEETINKIVQDKTPPAPIALPVPKPKAATPSRAKVVGSFDRRSEGVKTAAPVLPVTEQQFVRDIPSPAPGAKLAGEAIGNSKSADAEMISRYEQMISTWIEKFKVYPDSARDQGMQGETMVRVRLDRRGNIHYYALERSTGHNELDRAAVDMVRRANPVPAVPDNYPPGDMLEFLIPVSFHLQ